MWMDSEFTGFKKYYTDKLFIMPKKEAKGEELTADAKAWNWINTDDLTIVVQRCTHRYRVITSAGIVNAMSSIMSAISIRDHGYGTS